LVNKIHKQNNKILNKNNQRMLIKVKKNHNKLVQNKLKNNNR